jgi:hypothetical protein
MTTIRIAARTCLLGLVLVAGGAHAEYYLKLKGIKGHSTSGGDRPVQPAASAQPAHPGGIAAAAQGTDTARIKPPNAPAGSGGDDVLIGGPTTHKSADAAPKRPGAPAGK